MKMRQYYKNFLSFNGHPHIVNFIQIDISLYLISFSSEHTHTTFYYIEVFQATSLMSATNIDHYFSKRATIYCIAF